MGRSRFFGAICVVTAASLAVSSVASARLMTPVPSADAMKNPAIRTVDKWQDKRERKRIEWQRHYNRDRGPDRPQPRRQRGHRDHDRDFRDRGRRDFDRHSRDRGRHAPHHRTVIVKPVPPGPRVVVPRHRRYHYRNVWVVRPHGHWYHGYGHHHHYHDAYPWLAFTAITLSLLTLLTVAQQRAQEQAQINATTAPVGSSIAWNDANASGSVSVLRDGRSADGQYCREFLQTVTVGGRSEQAYGTACRQPDGAWRIVETR